MKHKVFEKKEEFYAIFDSTDKDLLNYVSQGKTTHDELIEEHLKDWTRSRIWGISASLCLDSCILDAIKLIDEIAIDYFKK